MTEWKEKKLAEAKWKYPSIMGVVDLCTGYIEKQKDINLQEKDQILDDCIKNALTVKEHNEDECKEERKKAWNEEIRKEFDEFCQVESDKDLIIKTYSFVIDRTEAIHKQKLELKDPLKGKPTKEEFKE